MNLVSKIHPAAADAVFYRRVLKLPKPSADYVRAETAFREASNALRSLTHRREALKIEAGVDNPGRNKIPSETLRSMLLTLADEISAKKTLHNEASAEFDKERTAYRDHARASLADDIEGLGSLISQRLDELRELLDVAAALSGQAREARVEMPTLISDAPVAIRLLEPVANTIVKMIGRGSRA
ncbi:MAG: hypothetical protein EOS52_23715 [Mesorhizobium sp.]|uniref:hypothetical protein n=1 Tax=Mesorhizobium sp. TaxID=1871066 RepID=UPI000FE9CC28|nr:hypothetical protein [Mesorhizobium sp.]RWC10780.1 MAG: hypothetical protein EOS52_23715 [Mesorhizobium sp.]